MILVYFFAFDLRGWRGRGYSGGFLDFERKTGTHFLGK
jgi:hypothetical protein